MKKYEKNYCKWLFELANQEYCGNLYKLNKNIEVNEELGQ